MPSCLRCTISDQGRRGRRPLHYIFVGAILAVALNPIWWSRTIQMYNPKECHPERNEIEPSDLRILELLCRELMRRSFDSLRSLGMTWIWLRGSG